VAAQVVDGRRGRVLLVRRRQALAFVEDEALLVVLALAFPGLRDGGDELGVASARDDPLGWLPLVVEFPVLRRVFVRGVEDGALEKAVFHN
jgi:hypothetical protein